MVFSGFLPSFIFFMMCLAWQNICSSFTFDSFKGRLSDFFEQHLIAASIWMRQIPKPIIEYHFDSLQRFIVSMACMILKHGVFDVSTLLKPFQSIIILYMFRYVWVSYGMVGCLLFFQQHFHRLAAGSCYRTTPVGVAISDLGVSASNLRDLEAREDGKSLIWVFPKIGIPQNGWFIMENSIKIWMIWGYRYFRKHPYGELGEPTLI